MGRLSGKIAIITGGASGFGRGACELWAREGAKIVACDLDAAAGNAVEKAVRADGGDIRFVPSDISTAEGAQSVVAYAVKEFGGVDILYNNAGILGPRGIFTADFPEEDARRLWEVNFMGTFLPTKYALPQMIKRGGGAIISTASESAARGTSGFCVYAPTKAAIFNFSMVVAMEYARHGIRSNTVSPGAGKTPMHNDLFKNNQALFDSIEAMVPLGRAADPQDVASAALFLASDDAKYITGTNLLVDGGFLAKGYF